VLFETRIVEDEHIRADYPRKTPKCLSIADFPGVPLGATGATFCPGLAGFGNRNCLKSLIVEGRTVNSHAGGHRFETGRSHFESINYGDVLKAVCSFLVQGATGCHAHKKSFLFRDEFPSSVRRSSFRVIYRTLDVVNGTHVHRPA
jgi:hypothetical protein